MKKDIEPTPPTLPIPTGRDEKEELRAESRIRTQLAKGVTEEELGMRENIRQAGFRAGQLGEEVERLGGFGTHPYGGYGIAEPQGDGYGAAMQAQQAAESGRELREKKAELKRAQEEKDLLTAAMRGPTKSPYSDLSAQELKDLQEHAAVSLEQAEKELETAIRETEGLHSDDPEAEIQRVDTLRAERDKWQNIVNDVGSEYYFRENEEQRERLKADEKAGEAYAAALEISEDLGRLDKALTDPTSYNGMDSRWTGGGEALKKKYGMEDLEALRKWLTEEKERLTGLLEEQGYDFARMAEYDRGLRSQDIYEKTQERLRREALEHPVWSSLATTILQPLQGADYVRTVLNGYGHSDPTKLESYVPANVYDMYATNFVRGIRGTVAEDLARKHGFEIGGTNVAAFFYQTGMSMGDFLFNSMITGNFAGGLGGAGSEAVKKVAANLSLAIMGSGAAANTTAEAIERGLSNQQAFTLGGIAGLAEILTEKVSLETLLDKTALDRSAWGYLCKNVLAEGSEEVASDLINWTWDVIVAKDRSQWAQAIKAYQNKGMDEKEAFQEALKDQIISMGWSGLGGALSGGTMAGSAMAVNWAANGGPGQNVTRQALESMAEQIMNDPEAVQRLGIKLTEDMTAAEKRRAVMEGLKWTIRGSTEMETGEATDGESGGSPTLERIDGSRRERGTELTEYPEKRREMLRQTGDNLGENGQKALMKYYNGEEMVDQYYGGFTVYYDAGVAGIAMDKVKSPYGEALTEIQRHAAYYSGQEDARVALEKTKEGFASVAGEDVGLVWDEYIGKNLKKKDFRRLNTICKSLGVRAYFVDTVGEGDGDGGIAPMSSDIQLARNMTNPVRFVLGHELTHRIQDLAPDSYRIFQRAMVEQLGPEELNARMEATFQKYRAKGREIRSAKALDEVTADFGGELMENGELLDRFIEANRAPEKRGVLVRLLDAVRGLLDRLTGKQREQLPQLTQAERKLTEALEAARKRVQENARQPRENETALQGEDGEMRLSIKNTSKMTLQEQLKRYYDKKMPSGEAFYFGMTPTELGEAGLDALPLAMIISDFKKSTKEKHHVPRRVLKALNNDMKTALFTFAEGDRIGIVTGDIDGDGKPLLIGIERNVWMGSQKVNIIRSIYGLDHPQQWLKNQIESGKRFTVLDQERANAFLYPYGYLASREEGIRSLDDKITQDGGEVKERFYLKGGDMAQALAELERENERLRKEILSMPERSIFDGMMGEEELFWSGKDPEDREEVAFHEPPEQDDEGSGETAVSHLISDEMAEDLLRDRTSVRFLTRKGGLKLNSDMSRSEQIAAVKEAAATIMRKGKPASEGEGGHNLETFAEHFATDTGTETGLILDDYVQKKLRPQTAERINVLGQALGVRVRFVNSVRGGTANASIQDGEVLIERYNPNPVMYLLGHELTHRVQQLAPESYRQFKEAIRGDVEKEAQGLYTLYQSRGVKIDYEGAIDEATANYAGRLIENGQVLDEFIAKHRTDRSLLEKLLDGMRHLISKLTGEEKRKAQTAEGKLKAALDEAAERVQETGRETSVGENGEINYSLKGKSFTEDKYYSRLMDRWSELPGNSRVKVGQLREGSALAQAGMPTSSMYFDVGKIKKAMEAHGDHLTAEVLKGIPDLLNDPIVITEYTGPDGTIKNTVSVYGNLFVEGTPVVVGIVMHLDSSGQNVISNIRTIHARSDFAKQITDQSVLYLNEDKKRTRSWFQVCGILNVPLDGTKYGLIRSITFDE